MARRREPEIVREAAAMIRRRLGRGAGLDVGVVLGSGLGGSVPLDRQDAAIPFGRIPGFPRPGVAGHAGRLLVGRLGDLRVAVLAGRTHLYEGIPFDEVVRPVRTLVLMGCGTMILTNAAGGVRPSLRRGEILGIRDHLNLQGAGPQEPVLGPRFVSMRGAYDPALLRLARSAAREEKIPLRSGVYAAVRGPAYETPAEIAMLRKMGADAVGMSTVPEVIAARQMGARCLGLSLITNTAAGHHAGSVTHEEVIASGERFAARLGRLLPAILRRITRDG